MPLFKHSFRLKDGTTKKTQFWYYRFEFNGKRYMGSTKTSNRKQAEAIEKKTYEALVNKYELNVTESITVEQAIKNYLTAVKDSGEYNSKVTYTNKLLGSKQNVHSADREDLEIFGFDPSWNFEKITNVNVSQLVMARKREGNKSGTILGELSVLSRMIEINRQFGVPCPVIDFKEIKRVNQLKPSKGKLRYLTEEEEQALLAELHPDKMMNGIGGEHIETTRQQRQDVYDFIVLLLDLGARHTEVANLTWDDIDLKERTVNIYRNKVKNQSILHMTSRVFNTLNRRKADSDSKYVFTAKDGGPRKHSSRAFDSACRRSGIEGVSIHTMRHTFASRLVQRGASLMEVQQLLGHKTPSVTLVYAHLAPNQAAKKAAQLLEK